MGSPSIGLGVHKPRLGVPKPSLGIPKPRLEVPKFTLGVPKTRLGDPKPSLDLGTPNLGLGTPSLGVGTKLAVWEYGGIWTRQQMRSSHIYIYIWHLLICFMHRNLEGWACTLILFGIASGRPLVPLLGSSLLSAAMHARSEALRFVTANYT